MFATRATGVVVRSAGMSHYNFLLADLALRIIVPQKVPEFLRTFVAHKSRDGGRQCGFRLFRPGQKNRRKGGVNPEKVGRAPKKNLKILLTGNGWWKILPVAPVTAFPPEVRSDVPLLSARRTKLSEEYRCLYN